MISSSGLGKKLKKLSKLAEVRMWQKSIINHVYSVAAIAPAENRKEHLRATWLSLDNHINDEHEHESQLYPYCDHCHLLYDREKEWLVRGIYNCFYYISSIHNSPNKPSK